MGALLGLGPERSLGFDLLFNLWCGIPRTIACRLPATPVLPCLYGVGFPYGADDLLKTILYSLNPIDNAAIGSVMGCFQHGPEAGYIQQGRAWWIL